MFLNIFKVIHFIFEISKTVERKKEKRIKSKFNYNKIFNLFEVTKIISTFRLKKLKHIKFLVAILRSCFFQELTFFFLAFYSSLLALFSFLVWDNLFLSFSSFKSLVWLFIMYFFKGVYTLRNFKKTIFFISFSESISFQKYSVKIS